jgi:glycosyltransferase involved in cell wall biosynthesis
MKLSLYTFVRDGLKYDFHVVEMLKHHLPLVDELIVNEGYSTDGTFEQISHIDPKIQVFRSQWGDPTSWAWYCQFKNEARKRCTGDWCVYLDCDEFIPEWQFEPLRRHLADTSEDLVAIDVINFYANYRVLHAHPEKVHWPSRKLAIHRNRPNIEFWGDGSNVRVIGQDITWPPPPYEFSCHHFGYVRHASRLREKWRSQNRMYKARRFGLSVPGFVFDLFPHRWDDPAFFDDLEAYEGPYIRPVRDNPKEFVRDGMQTYEAILQRNLERSAAARVR